MKERNINNQEEMIIPEVEVLLEKLQKENEELKDKYLRASAELDNFRKRTLKEKSELIKTAGEKTITSILPILDDLERANSEVEKANTEDNLEACLEGYVVISNKLSNTLEGLGLERVDPLGEDFNPDLYEAISLFPTEYPEADGKIIQVLQPGYKLGDKMIRFAKVIVGQYKN